MKCPKCNSAQTVKNGHRRGKHCFKCRQCGRQFVSNGNLNKNQAQITQNWL